MHLSEFWKIARSELERSRPVYLCLVVAQRKGTPGTTAARMLLTSGGRQYGTIGGGIMEKRVLEEAARLIAGPGLREPRLVELKHRIGDADTASGLICGGGQTNLEMILEPEEHLEVVRRISEAAEAEDECCAVFRPAGLSLEKREEESGKVELQGGGDAWTAFVPLRNPRRVAVFGGGHCGSALAELMDRLGYAVTVIEPRPGLPAMDVLSSRVSRVAGDFEGGAAGVRFPSQTIAVVMTYSMPTDVEALAGILKVGFREVGLMGSKPKIARIAAALREKGFPNSQISKIRAPVGLEFNSDTPDEIAVSVAARILLERERS